MEENNKSRLLQELLKKEVSEGYTVGAQLGVYEGEKEIFFCSEGMADREDGKPITRDTIFRLYSMTKPVTSVTAHIMIERGLLSKDDLLEKYLPEFSKMTVYTENGFIPAAHKIRIRDLLNMTSGLVYPGDEQAETVMQELFDDIDGRIRRGETEYTTAEVIAKIAERPLLFEPGSRWHYGTSADVLGRVLEVIAASTLGEIFSKEIFEPLGMIDTGFYVPEEKQHRFAQLYRKLPEGIECNQKPDALVIDENRHLGLTRCLKKPGFESGGAGLVSTAEDYSRFLRMISCGGTWKGQRIISEDTVKMFTKSRLDPAVQPSFDWEHLQGYSYSNYMRVGADRTITPDIPTVPGRSIRSGEIGWDGWCGPYCYMDPGRGISAVYLVQTAVYQHRDFIHRLRSILND